MSQRCSCVYCGPNPVEKNRWQTVNPRTVLAPAAKVFNSGIIALSKAPVLGPRISGSLAQIRYIGRRSGQTISTPVTCRRSGDEYVIRVATPEWKTWWRNFLGEGQPATLILEGTEHAGHAVARRDDNGNVTVHVQLDKTE